MFLGEGFPRERIRRCRRWARSLANFAGNEKCPPSRLDWGRRRLWTSGGPRGGRLINVYALALGRAATFSYQRRKARAPPGIGIFSAAVAKSTVTSAVMWARREVISGNERHLIETVVEVHVEIGDRCLLRSTSAGIWRSSWGPESARPLRPAAALRTPSMVGAKPSSSTRRSHMTIKASSTASVPSSGRSGESLFEISPDCRYLGESSAIVKDERRHLLAWIDRLEPLRKLLPLTPYSPTEGEPIFLSRR